MKQLLILASLLCTLPSARARADDTKPGEWEAVRDEDGISVRRRAVPGSPLHEFQGRAIVDAPIPAVLGVIDDAEHRKEWMSQCVASWTVERNGDKLQISYFRNGAPWPISDRDGAMRGEVTVDVPHRFVRIDITAVPHPKVPVNDGIVRFPYLKGHWLFRPVNAGKATSVEYQIHADPGGSLPNWVINWVSKKLPYETLRNLREQVKKRQYPEFVKHIQSLPEFHDFAEAIAADEAAKTQPHP
jgi:hypothetical protein